MKNPVTNEDLVAALADRDHPIHQRAQEIYLQEKKVIGRINAQPLDVVHALADHLVRCHARYLKHEDTYRFYMDFAQGCPELALRLTEISRATDDDNQTSH